MTETMHGHVDSVRLELAGDVVTSALSVGASQVPIGDAADFDELGGSLTFNGTTIYTYTMLDDGDDSGTPLLSISPTLAVAVAAGDWVRVWNPQTSPADYVKEWVASVTDDLDGNSIEATVSHSLIGRLDEGVEALSGRSVACTMDEDGDWVVTDVIGEAPVITGAVVRTAADGERWELSSRPSNNELRAYFSDEEFTYLGTNGGPDNYNFFVAMPSMDDIDNANLSLSASVETTPTTIFNACADRMMFYSLTLPLIFKLELDTFGMRINDTRGLNGIDFDTVSTGADASGDVTVSHNLGAVPETIQVTGQGTNSRIYSVHSITSSSFKVRTWNDAGTVMNAGVTVTFKWIALI